MTQRAFDIVSRARAAFIHIGASAAVVALAAALVFVVWYPMPYREISGGRELFTLLVLVDVIVGPLITFAVFDLRKPRPDLARDLGVVAALQLAALGYGLYVLAEARPAVVALEGDRLRVVRAIDLADADFAAAPEGLREVSWWGPVLLATRAPTAGEKLDAIDRGLGGEDIGMRPKFWRPLAETGSAYAKAARPISDLIRRPAPQWAEIERAGRATGLSSERLGYLPLLARSTDWSLLIDRQTGSVVGSVHVDGF